MTAADRFLLDTNIISETMRKKPDAAFMRWYNARPINSLFLSSIAMAELWQGLCSLNPTEPRAPFYQAAIKLIETQYKDRILPFDSDTARLWGEMRGYHRRKGRALPDLDSQIAAIALQHKLTLVTANMRHFQGLNIALLNPMAQK